jgi:hypothetical protein
LAAVNAENILKEEQLIIMDGSEYDPGLLAARKAVSPAGKEVNLTHICTLLCLKARKEIHS